MEKGKDWFLGLWPEGTAVGYGAAGADLRLWKRGGAPVWGAQEFDRASSGEERRLFRAARRRLDRRQQRIALAEEIFAPVIGAVDPDFFRRRRESALLLEDRATAPGIFGDREADRAYARRYPTIHHLIWELGQSDEEHDPRLVYMGCAWLLGHRGSFLPPEEGVSMLLPPAGMTVSQWKVAVYEAHRRDLAALKGLTRRYRPEGYGEMFRARRPGLWNYGAYAAREGASPEEFGRYVRRFFRDVTPAAEDAATLADIRERCARGTFMPRQTGAENRAIPHEAMAAELEAILEKAAGYLPFLTEPDEDGFTPAAKLRALMDFRVPYYVGPLAGGWMVRKAEGPIRPWNFEQTVDAEASEEAFIRRLTGRCEYLPGEERLPLASMAYQRFVVLEEVNGLRAGGRPLDEAARARVLALFEKGRRVTAAAVEAAAGTAVTGMGPKSRGALGTQRDFHRLLEAGTLSEADVETIVGRGAYCQEPARMEAWLAKAYPGLDAADRAYIAGLKFRGWGRLSRRFLEEFPGAKKSTGEADTVLGWMARGATLNELLGEGYTFREQIRAERRQWYDGRTVTLEERLEDMGVGPEGRRPIRRALDVARDVEKAMGRPPKRVFLASGSGDDRRAESRYDRVKALYAGMDDDGGMKRELEATPPEDMARDRVYLYFLQMGRCAYTGARLRREALDSGAYTLEHIYPRRLTRDDRAEENLVLVAAEANRRKGDGYPLGADIRADMEPVWAGLRDRGLMSGEKYARLTRAQGFTPAEAWEFIARQSRPGRTLERVLGRLLEETWPETEVVYVARGLVGEFRQVFGLGRAVSVNGLYRARDAYLAIVVGQVWRERFTRQWFFGPGRGAYTLNAGGLFGHPVIVRGREIWAGQKDAEAVAHTIRRQSGGHLTRYAYCRGGALFDGQPVAAGSGLVGRKADLPPEKYGGYTGLTVAFFLLARFRKGTRARLALVPVRSIAAAQVGQEAGALDYVQKALGPKARDVDLPLGPRPLKINTMLDMGGYRVCLRGVSGERVAVSPVTPLVVGWEWEDYVRRLERGGEGTSPERNLALYDLLQEKLASPLFGKRPGDGAAILRAGRETFRALDPAGQRACLGHVLELFGGNVGGCDLSAIGGKKRSAVPTFSAVLNSWPVDGGIWIVDPSPSGIFERRSPELMGLLEEI